MRDAYLNNCMNKILTYFTPPTDETEEPKAKRAKTETASNSKIQKTIQKTFDYMHEAYADSSLQEMHGLISDFAEFAFKTTKVFDLYSDRKKELQELLGSGFGKLSRNQRETILSRHPSLEHMNQKFGADFFKFIVKNTKTQIEESFYLNLNCFKETALYGLLLDMKAKTGKEELELSPAFILGLKILEDKKNEILFLDKKITSRDFDSLAAAALAIYSLTAAMENPETILLKELGAFASNMLSAPQFYQATKNKITKEEVGVVLKECDTACEKFIEELPAPSVFLDDKTREKLVQKTKHKNEVIKKFYKVYAWITPDFIESCKGLILYPESILLPGNLLDLRLMEHKDVRGLEPLQLLLELAPSSEFQTSYTMIQAIKRVVDYIPSTVSLPLLKGLLQGLSLTVNNADDLKHVGRILERTVGKGYPLLTLRIQEPNQDEVSTEKWEKAWGDFKNEDSIQSIIYRPGINTQIGSFFEYASFSNLKKLDITGSEREAEKGGNPWEITFNKKLFPLVEEISLVGLTHATSVNLAKKQHPHVHSARIFLEQTSDTDPCCPPSLGQMFPNVRELHLSCANNGSNLHASLTDEDLANMSLEKLEELEICFYDTKTYSKEKILFPKINWEICKPGPMLRTITLSCRPEYPKKMNAATFSVEDLEGMQSFLQKNPELTIKLDHLQLNNKSEINDWLRKIGLEKLSDETLPRGQLILTHSTYKIG